MRNGYSGFRNVHKKSVSNALANQNAALDRSQTRFVHMLEHEFESRFEICVLIGQRITSAFDLCCKILENHCTSERYFDWNGIEHVITSCIMYRYR